ncbi:MAG TPA: amino acid permease [Gammaproteobacteria bacterium]
MNTQASLKRSLSLGMITFFGLGNILGAGIYVLVGKVAGEAGYYAPLAFFVASIIAALSAFTYAELSSRYPVSAGVAAYIHQAFHRRYLSVAIGLMMVLAVLVSTSVLMQGFAGYLRVMVDLPEWLISSGLALGLGVLVAAGITASARVAVVLTLVEIAGLLLVVFYGGDYLLQHQPSVETSDHSPGAVGVSGILAGAFLAFYAYMGFEDMVNVAEEVKAPEKNMPRAILLALLISTILYGLVSTIAIWVLTPAELATSDAPLVAVYQAASGNSPQLMSIIGLIALINGALVQLIMASRMLYGMSSRGWIPAFLSRVNRVSRTPLNSTLLVVMVVLLFTTLFELVMLAQLTSFIILTVFAMVNLALLVIKKTQPVPSGVAIYPAWVPLLGFISSLGFVLHELLS